MFAILASTVAASEVCQNSMQEMNIGYDECMAIQTEFHAMVDSGKTTEELTSELATIEKEPGCEQGFGIGADNACNRRCGLDNDCVDSCMQIANNGVCRIDSPGCARQVAYGGYVKSHVLIQCYGMIDEGCKRLKTKYMPQTHTSNGAANGVAAPAADKWPTCSDLCNTDKCGSGCNIQNGNACSLRGVDCGCGDDCQSWGHTCMKQHFNKYLHCVGKRVAKCYRQKWIVSKECINGAPTAFGGCKKEWDQEYHCEGSGCGSGCNGGSC
jgi:hypothetical protein